MSINSREIETSLVNHLPQIDGRPLLPESSPVPTSFTYDQLYEEKLALGRPVDVRIVQVNHPTRPTSTIYNGGLFMDHGVLHLVARAEELDSEMATVDEYVFRSDSCDFSHDPQLAPKPNRQDPSPIFTPRGIVHSAVKTISSPDDPSRIVGYRSIISRQDSRKTIAKGPLGQKGLKIFYYQDQYLVVVRRRQETAIGSDSVVDSSSHLGWAKKISHIRPKFVESVYQNPQTRILGFFAPGEWGNVADSMLLLEDSRVAFMGHIAKFGNTFYDNIGERQRHYSVIVGILDPFTLQVSQVRMLATAADVHRKYPSLPPKRDDLGDVVYPRTMGYTVHKNTFLLVGCFGVGDRHTGVFTTPWPFTVRPDLSAAQNSIFAYPADTINRLIGS